MVVIGQLSKTAPSRATHAEEGGTGDRSIRQRNELMFVGDVSEPAALPVLFGLLDPFLAGGDEIPPDVTGPLQRVAAEKHHPRRFCRFDGDAVARPKDQQTWPLMAVAGNFNLAIDQVDRALLMIRVERDADALLRRDLGVKPRRHHRNRRFYAERAAGDDARGETAVRYRRHIGGRVMLRRRRDFFGCGRQWDPALQAPPLLAV